MSATRDHAAISHNLDPHGVSGTATDNRPRPLATLNEPTTILARPSAVWWTHVAWLVLAVAISVTLAPRWAGAAPWLFAPLILARALSRGALAALTWSLVAMLLVDLAPPGSDHPGSDIVTWLAATAVLVLASRAWNSAWWVPWATGVGAGLAWWATGLAMRTAQTGRLELPLVAAAISCVTTGVLVGVVTPRWVRWAHRERLRGRA